MIIIKNESHMDYTRSMKRPTKNKLGVLLEYSFHDNESSRSKISTTLTLIDWTIFHRLGSGLGSTRPRSWVWILVWISIRYDGGFISSLMLFTFTEFDWLILFVRKFNLLSFPKSLYKRCSLNTFCLWFSNFPNFSYITFTLGFFRVHH